MRSLIRLGLTLLLALPIVAVTTATPASPYVPSAATAARSTKLPWQAGGVRFVPGQVVVTLKPSASRRQVRALDARIGADVISRAPGLAVDVVRVARGISVDAVVRRFERSSLVRFAEPNRIATPTALPDDTYFSDQWALNNTGQSHEVSDQGGGPGHQRHGTADADVDAPQAWGAQTVHAPVVVAVLDTGVDIDHPDLVNSMWVNTGETPGNGIDDDGNGFKDDVNGWDFEDHKADPSPPTTGGPLAKLDNAHGTHVAGIVAAEQDNAEGVSGVCPDCSIMALRIGSASAGISLGAELRAIDYAIANGADIINLSIGTPVWSKAERTALRRAGNHGILVVVSAGNSSLDNDIAFQHVTTGGVLDAWAPSFPASYTLTNILAVAASNDRDQYGLFSQCVSEGFKLWQCGFTSWGHDSVDVAAPGVDIRSTITVGVGLAGSTDPDYDVWDGTSMASPLVAGIAGLVRSEHPGYGPVQIKNAIMNSVDHPGLKLFTSWADVTRVGKSALSGNFTRTQGRVNARRAIIGSTANATPASDGNINGAKPIVQSKLGHVAWPADVNDVYKKKLAKGARYSVVLDGPQGSDMDLWVWNPGTTEIFQFTVGCFTGGACPAVRAVSERSNTADEKVTFTATKSGVYYFQVNGWYRGGNYKLAIKRV